MPLDAGVLSLDATLTLTATRTGDDTSLAEITRLCAAAEDRKSRLARLADRAAAIYAPVVHLVALATFIGWIASGASAREGLLAAVAVLIVTCPCALGLAAPMAQAVASGALFRRGIMLKDGAALERLATVDRVVFDKTGVLTRGVLSALNPDVLRGDTLQRAMSLAANSTHPLARATVQLGEAQGFGILPVSDVSEVPGEGIGGTVAGIPARLGSAAHCGVPDRSHGTDVACW
jgi:Cu2+-exporting ATPase